VSNTYLLPERMRRLWPGRKAYDDDRSIYSPSSIHRFFRSARNGKLYWMANMTSEPSPGNGLRYPLYIAEIDEEKAVVKRESLLLVDDRRAGELEAVQLSNFCIVEDRETLDIEIYLTRIGENAEHFCHCAVVGSAQQQHAFAL